MPQVQLEPDSDQYLRVFDAERGRGGLCFDGAEEAKLVAEIGDDEPRLLDARVGYSAWSKGSIDSQGHAWSQEGRVERERARQEGLEEVDERAQRGGVVVQRGAQRCGHAGDLT